MTALPGLGAPACLRLGAPVWGVDTSTVRMSCAGLLPDTAKYACGPRLVWDTLSLPRNVHLPARQAAAVRAMVPWLAGLEERWGTPAVIGYEQPLAGGNTPLPSFYVVGALLAAIGEVFGVDVEAAPWNPPEWKMTATGQGYIRGLPKGMDKREKRRREKARLVEWAREAGYVGELDDEADAIGVATATGVRFERRLRMS